MEEDKQNGQWTDVLHQEEISVEITPGQFTAIGKLVAHNLVVYVPTNEDAGQEAYHRQEYLTRDEVKPFEERLTKELQPVIST